jgi:hypothetical protein
MDGNIQLEDNKLIEREREVEGGTEMDKGLQ